MISYIKGRLMEADESIIVVETSGIGYNILVPSSLISELPSAGSEVKIYTYLYIREDAVNLYGFISRDDLKVFKLLIGVSGIGPKGALAVLSVMTPDDLRFAVLSEDAKAISKVPGIGNKTAQRLIIELKDKLSLEEAFEIKRTKSEDKENAYAEVRSEAVQALAALGYSQSDALRAVNMLDIADTAAVEQVIKQALSKLLMF